MDIFSSMSSRTNKNSFLTDLFFCFLILLPHHDNPQLPSFLCLFMTISLAAAPGKRVTVQTLWMSACAHRLPDQLPPYKIYTRSGLTISFPRGCTNLDFLPQPRHNFMRFVGP